VADNISVKNSAGTAVTLGAKDLSSVYLMKQIRVDDAGNIAPAGDTVGRAGHVIVGNGTIALGVFAEDAAHSSAHTGLMPLTVRQDTAAALAGTDADYQPLITDSAGKLHVNVGAVTPGTAASSLGKAEDAAHTTADVGVMALAVRTDAPTDRSGTDGDYEPLQVSGGRQWVSGKPGTVLTATPTIDTAIYASGDLLGTKLTLTNAVRVASTGGKIMSVTVVDQAKQSIALDVLFFEADPTGTTFTNNAALDVADADLLNAVGSVSVVAGDYIALADNSLATVKNVNLRFKLDSGTSLYACLITRGTPTYAAATDIQLKVGVEQD
jgi:hypothetical protein